jgi:hypothetical protein
MSIRFVCVFVFGLCCGRLHIHNLHDGVFVTFLGRKCADMCVVSFLLTYVIVFGLCGSRVHLRLQNRCKVIKDPIFFTG